MTAVIDYSGIVLNQNQPPSIVPDGDSLVPSTTLAPSTSLFPAAATTLLNFTGGGYCQTFQLPGDYARGDNIPPLTGFQLFAEIAVAETATLTWALDQLIDGAWVTLTSGETVGTAQTGGTWFSVYFSAPVPVDLTWATDTFRIAMIGATGFTGVYYSTPNPLSTGQAFDFTAEPLIGPPIEDGGASVSVLFRILADIADSGTDFLGNVYRSTVVRTLANDASVIGDLNSYWLSQPSPSQFAVEAFYLDMRNNNDAVVMDRMTIDPITPDVFAHVYYSNDPNGPGLDSASWDNLMWTPAYLPIQMARKTTYAFPQPITAKYVKVEFTNLQARAYDPGAYQVPSTFRKFPRWVLDFFLGQFAALTPDLLSSAVQITYDALDLAYSYYQADLIQQPDSPALAKPFPSQQAPFQTQPGAQADAQSLAQIALAFQPFTSPPALQGDTSTVLGAYAVGTATANYSTEIINVAQANTSIVSNLQREPLLVEKGFPVMFFFLPCRHGYRVSQAMFEKNIGYFAGVNQLAFHRDLYTGPVDQVQYNETLGDGANVALNDWVTPSLTVSGAP